MLSLRELRASHARLLLIDAASLSIQAAVFGPGPEDIRWARAETEAGIGIFSAVSELGVDPNSADAFLFCEGPGSILGIRTAATALRTWRVLRDRPAYAYCSLAVVASARGNGDVPVIADARRDSWHHFTRAQGLRRVPTAELTGPLLMPSGFRHWTELPAGLTVVPYDLAGLLVRSAETPLFREAPEPDAFLHEEPSYRKWTPRIHRAS